MLHICNDEKSYHSDNRAQISKDVRKCKGTLQGFIHPFQIDCADILYCRSFGAKTVFKDLMHANSFGKEAFENFAQKRLMDHISLADHPQQYLHHY